MCDTLVALPAATRDGATWFGKNSDREPTEAQAVEHHEARGGRGHRTVRCTWMELPEAGPTEEVVLSRPAWMWGAEMGVNASGVAIGNEAVFTRVPVAERGLLGMDLVRLALERATSADGALEVICWMLGRYGQGGRAGHRDARFRYHNSFLIADRERAWVLETAGPYWAAERVRDLRTISNRLSIGEAPDLVGPGTVDAGWRLSGRPRGGDFHFANSFAHPWLGPFTGGRARARCSAGALGASRGAIGGETLRAALRSHAGLAPRDGLTMRQPCAHARWLPTRRAGQTTGSLVARLSTEARVWATGTSSPCISVFKPVPLGEGPFDAGPSPAADGEDSSSLFWRHERLHRAVIRDYDERRAVFERARRDEEARALSATSSRDARDAWARHRELAVEWARAAVNP